MKEIKCYIIIQTKKTNKGKDEIIMRINTCKELDITLR